uniref:Uncharacterized protein n=1 Tax=Solanum tuberosum TaxID=4113 RepID=M1DN76_SOLTU
MRKGVKKLEKLKKREDGAHKSHSATRRVSLQLAQSSSELADFPKQLGEKKDDLETRRLDRLSRSSSSKLPEQFDAGVRSKGEKKHNSAIRRVDRSLAIQMENIVCKDFLLSTMFG